MVDKTQINYKLIRKIGLLALVMSIFVGLFRIAYSVPQVKEAIALATTKKPETFTELYFENHINLPKIYVPGEEQYFKFTIHNLEHRDTTYKYEIYAIDDIENITLSSGTASLAHDEYKSIDESYMMATSSGRTNVVVKLIDKNQSIHFWIENI